MTFKTGRARTLRHHGDTSGSASLRIWCDMEATPDPQSRSEFTAGLGYVEAYGIGILGDASCDYIPGAENQCLEEYTVIAGHAYTLTDDGVTVDSIVVDNTTLGVGSNESFNFEYEFILEVEEWVDVRFMDPDTEEAVLIHGAPFPTFGGSATAWATPAYWATFYEMPIPEAEVIVNVTTPDGDMTYSKPAPAVQYSIYTYARAATDFTTHSTSISAFLNGLPYEADVDITLPSGEVTHGGGTLTATVTAFWPIGWKAEGDATTYPPICYDLKGIVRAIGPGPTATYPGSLALKWRAKATGDQAVTLDPEGDDTVRQRTYLVRGFFNDDLIDSDGVSEVIPVCAWLDNTSLSGAGEDSTDWRTPFQIYPWAAHEYAHASSRTIASAVTLTEDGDVTFLSANREGHRYLRIPFTWTGADKTLTLTIGTKEYALPVTAGSHTADIDLCLGVTNLPEDFKVDERDGRWPLEDGPTSDPDEATGDEKEDGWLFGDLSRTSAMGVSGIGEEESLALSALTLVRKVDAEVGVLLPFDVEQRVWTSETDTTYGHYDLWLYADRKQCGPVPFLYHVDPTSGDDSLAFQTLAQIESFIDGTILGWTVTPQTVPSDSPYDADEEATKLLGFHNEAAHLDPYLWTGSGWRDQTALSPTATLWSCFKVDMIETYPGCGDPRAGYDENAPEFPLFCSKVLRAQAEGLCGEDEQARAKSGIRVDLVTWPGELPRGSASSGSDGRYRTGSPWAFGNQDHRGRLRKFATTRYEEFKSANRYRERTSSLGAASIVNFLALLARRDGRLFRMMGEEDVTRFGVASTPTYTDWDDKDVYDVATDGSLIRVTGDAVLALLVVDGAVLLKIVEDEGNEEFTGMVTDGSGTAGDLAAVGDGSVAVYRVDAGTLKVTFRSAVDLSVISGPTDTNIDGLGDEDRISVDDVSFDGNQPGFILLVTSGGTTNAYASYDGIQFA